MKSFICCVVAVCNETPTASVTWWCSLSGQEILVTNLHLSQCTPCIPPTHIYTYLCIQNLLFGSPQAAHLLIKLLLHPGLG